MQTTRLELFNQVWETPMTKLAQAYNCSDVGLRKTCIRFDIPLPPNGHWQKCNYGKGYPKPNLTNPNHNPEITMHPKSMQRAKEAAEIEKEIKASLLEANPKLKPITQFTNLHPLAKRTYDLALVYEKEIKKLTKKWSWHDRDKFAVNLYSDKGRFIFNASDKCFPFTASIPSIFRAIKFLDPILKELEANGFIVNAIEEKDAYSRFNRKDTVFEKDGVKLKVRIREGYSKVTSKTKFRKDISIHTIGDYEENYYPNTILYFEVCHEYQYNWYIFKDKVKYKLEDQIHLILKYLLNAPTEIKTEHERRRIKREQAQHIDEVNQHNRRISESRKAQLKISLDELHSFKELNELDNYLKLIELESNQLSAEEQEVAHRWLTIVRLHAQENSPIARRINLFKQIANDIENKEYEYWVMSKREYENDAS